VLPTALSLLGVPFAAGDGVSLAPGQGRARPRRDRPIYAESLYPRRFGWSALRVLRDDRFKYIDAPRPELYDLLEDPLETVDVSAERAGTASAMRRALGTAVVEWPPVQSANATRERDDPELRARLGALGYVGFGPAPATPSGIDPKDVIRSYNESRRNLAR
jgi:arylsulfatase A-like enzyme